MPKKQTISRKECVDVATNLSLCQKPLLTYNSLVKIYYSSSNTRLVQLLTDPIALLKYRVQRDKYSQKPHEFVASDYKPTDYDLRETQTKANCIDDLLDYCTKQIDQLTGDKSSPRKA